MSPVPVTASTTLTLSPSKRFSEVDSLRAVACAMVVVSHSLYGFDISREQGGDVVWSLGQLGVLMFFAISGFVIPSSLRGTRWQGVKRFAVRRFWRLFPPFWFALLLTWWVGLHSSEQWLWDMAMLPSMGPRVTSFLHFWTLEVELFFYLTTALLFLVFGGLRWQVLLVAYISFGLYFLFKSFHSGVNFRDPLFALIVMFWGALCREILYFNFSRWSWLAPVRGVDWARSTVLGLLTGLLIFRPIVSTILTVGNGVTWDGIFASRLAVVLAPLGFLFWVVFKPVRIGWLSYVGRWTYSTYLLHIFPIAVYGWVMELPAFSIFSRLPLFSMGFVLVLSFAVGAVAYRWIEQPSDAIGKRLAARAR